MQQRIHIADQTPSLLVVIATLGKRNGYLEQTLKSIQAQDFKNVEITLIYPLSNKETQKLAKEYQAKSIADPGSMSSAVNLGIIDGWETYKYVTWIGDDDLFLPGSFTSTINSLEKTPHAAAAFGYCDYIDQTGKHLFTSKAGIFAPFIASWGPNLIPLPGTVFRCNSLKMLDHLFDENLRYTMDLDLFLRLKKIGKLISVNTPVSAFRWHVDSTTVANRAASLRETELVRRKYTPVILKPFIPLWEIPVRFATLIAAKRVSSL